MGCPIGGGIIVPNSTPSLSSCHTTGSVPAFSGTELVIWEGMRKKQRFLWLGGFLAGLAVILILMRAGETIEAVYRSVTSFVGLLPVTAETPRAPSPEDGGGAAAGDTKQAAAQEVDGEKPRLTPLPVAGVQVHPSDFVLTVRGTGRAEAWRRAELAPRVGESIRLIAVREGQFVKAGETLIELDHRPFEMSLKEAEANLVKAQLEFEAQLFDDDGADEEKRRRIAHRTGLTEAQQRLARAQLDLDGACIKAPFDGYIASIGGAVGERAQADRPLITLLDNHRIKIPAEVLESDFGSLTPGVEAVLRLPALPGEDFTGTVSALSPQVDPERGTGIVYIELPNPGGRIKPGMYAEVDIEAHSLPDRLSVPRPAVIERDRRLLVFVARGGRAEWSYVKTGLETDERIEVLSGVAPGDTVLVDGHLTLAHGAPVKVALLDQDGGK
jgi:RND family efflux transporter MFP subunit